MQSPEIPEFDQARVTDLHCLNILDTLPDPYFDDISELARRIAEADIATISFVDQDSQWFKSCVGASLGQQRIPRSISICGHTILKRDPFVIHDTHRDLRFSANPLVTGELGVRFYAGFQLVSSNGYALGSLCVISRQANQLMHGQIDSLKHLASIIVKQLERSRQSSLLSRNDEDLKGKSPSYGLPGHNLDSLQLLTKREQMLQILEMNVSAAGGGGAFSLLRCRFRDYDRINATLGGIVAEQFINEGARRILAAIPKSSSVARFSDSELVVLLPFEVLQSNVQRIVERMIGFCNQIYRIGTQTLPLGVSIGIAISNKNYAGAEAVLADASMALRLATRSSTNTFRFIDADSREVARASYRLESDLRDALNSREIECYLQPIVDLSSGAAIGFEALARWRRGSEIASPSTFLPMLNESGITGELDLLIIEQALACMPLLAQAVPQRSMTMSVNLSGLLLEDDELRRKLLDLIDSNVMPFGWTLQVELLEEAFQDSTESFEAFLNNLVDRDVLIAIDDFGTGYSSLARLISLPIKGVKVDRAFVMRIDEFDDSPRTLLTTMLTMLNDLNLVTTAEGVETAEQQQWLLDKGVGRAQGYLFHRPMPISEAIHLLQDLDYRPAAIPVDPRRLRSLRRRRRRLTWGFLMHAPWHFSWRLPFQDRRRPSG